MALREIIVRPTIGGTKMIDSGIITLLITCLATTNPDGVAAMMAVFVITLPGLLFGLALTAFVMVR